MGSDAVNEAYLQTVRRALASRRRFNKVFGIGQHKTGTTTLESVFRLCGLTVGNQAEGELAGFSARRGDFRRLADHVAKADAFQDSPFADGTVYAALDALFPDSRFILTVRDPRDWFRSLKSAAMKRWGLGAEATPTPAHLEADGYLFPTYVYEAHVYRHLLDTPSYAEPWAPPPPSVDWSKLFDEEHYVAGYERRNAQIRDYFKARPQHLLEVDLTQEATIRKVALFLGLPEAFGGIAMPHLNKT
jgi:hypothetical protein